MSRQSEIEGVILEELMDLSLADVCRACTTHAESIIELVDEGIITPVGDAPPLGFYRRASAPCARGAALAKRSWR